jgi:transposase
LLSKPFSLLVVLVLLWRDNIAVSFVAHCETVFRIAKQLEETGSVCDKRTKGRKRSTYVRKEEVVCAAQGTTVSPTSERR